jgi:uncharacterized protein YacL
VPKSNQPRRRDSSVTPAATVPPGRKPPGPPPDPGRILLAKIVSTLVGALLGILVANLIGLFFGGDFTQRIASAQKELSTLEERLDDDKKAIEQQQQVIDGLDQKIKQEGGLSGKAGDAAKLSEYRSERSSAYSDLQKLLDPYTKRLDRRVAVRADLKDLRGTLTNVSLLSLLAIGILTILGYLVYPVSLRYIEHSVDTWIAVYAQAERRSQTLLIGFFAGLIIAIAVLLAVFTTFSTGALADPIFRLVFGAFFVVGLGVAGSLVAVNYFGPGPRRVDPYREFRALAKPKVLDTSVLIDGRVQEVAATGFLDGTLVVTNSVLRELQALADSSDGRKRDKGRRGLELVHTMQEDPRLSVRIMDDSDLYDGSRATDDQLIVVAQAMGAAVVTNDYNLNRVAAIRDVQVINLNALANAVKTRHVPGDMIEIQIADRGKQRGQGVGYLEDGTMVVVEDGEPFIRQTRTIKLTSVTQTVQGRLIFGRVDLAEEENGHH